MHHGMDRITHTMALANALIMELHLTPKEGRGWKKTFECFLWSFIYKLNHNYAHLRCLLDIKEGRKEMFYLTTHSTHFIYGYMASDIW